MSDNKLHNAVHTWLIEFEEVDKEDDPAQYFIKMPSNYGAWVYENDLKPHTRNLKFKPGDKVWVVTYGNSKISESFLASHDAVWNPSSVNKIDTEDEEYPYNILLPDGASTWAGESDVMAYTRPNSKFQLLKQKEDGEEWVAWLDTYTHFVENGKPALLAEESAMWNDLYSLYKGFKMFQFHIKDTSPMFKFDIPEQAVFDVYSYGASETDIQHVIVEPAFPNKEGSAFLDALHSSLGIGGLGLHTIRFDSAVNIMFKGNSQQQIYPQIMEQLKANVAKINGSITIHPVDFKEICHV